jgi:streptomycin 6-kinase
MNTNWDALEALKRYRTDWRLKPDGDVITTPSSVLQPVIYEGAKAFLKYPTGEEERRGAAAMVYWGGEGAARVLKGDGKAQVLERLADDISLTEMAAGPQDSEATKILCAAVAALHTPRSANQPSSLAPLDRWFAALHTAAAQEGENQALFQAGLAIALPLISKPESLVVLHGDIHHANVLHDPVRGWLAIDPKGLIGDRGYDYANMLCNPLGAIAQAPGRLRKQAEVVSAASGLTLERVLRWVAAYSALSVAWTVLSPPHPTEVGLAMARIAQAELAALSKAAAPA